MSRGRSKTETTAGIALLCLSHALLARAVTASELGNQLKAGFPPVKSLPFLLLYSALIHTLTFKVGIIPDFSLLLVK